MSVIGSNILSGASGQGGAYEIEQSMYIGDGANSSPKLQRTCGTPQGTAAFTASTWMKRGSPDTGSKTIFSWIVATTNSTTPYAYLEILNDFPNQTAALHWAGYSGSGYAWNQYYNAEPDEITFQDYAAWTHVHLKISGTSAEIYFNGVLFRTGSFASGYYPVSGSKLQVGCNDSGQLGSCYFADTYYIDGQALAPTEFGEVNEDTGEWVPIEYSGTYAGNSVYLNYSDSADFGTDSSGEGNDFTATSIPAVQQSIDTPTNNFCNMNPLDKAGSMLSEDGNLRALTNSGTNPRMNATFQIPSTGKWYWEFVDRHGLSIMIGVDDQYNQGSVYGNNTSVIYNSGNGNKYNFSGTASYGASWTTGDIIGVALNRTDNQITFYKNNSTQGTLTIGGTAAQRARLMPMIGTGTTGAGGGTFNFGQDSSFFGVKTSGSAAASDGNGVGDFYYTPPTGYLALCTDNLADPAIENPAEHFNTVIYTGNATARDITDVGFQSDFTWIKMRDAAYPNNLFNSIIGDNIRLQSNHNFAEASAPNTVTFGNANGFSLGTDSGDFGVNKNTSTFVAWNWKAGGAPTADNSAGVGNTPTAGSVKINGSNLGSALAGSIAATRLSANTESGVSIIKFTGNQTSGATLAHGLSSAPEIVIIKKLGASGTSWVTGYSVGGESGFLGPMFLNSTAAKGGTDAGYFHSTLPSASVITLGNYGDSNGSTTMIAYAFHSVEGFSYASAYKGNGGSNNDGTFIYTGFRPAFVLIKNIDSVEGWNIWDSAREPDNHMSKKLSPNDTTLEYTANTTTYKIDFVSTGVKLRTSYSALNTNDDTYLIYAIAESAFKTANAR